MKGKQLIPKAKDLNYFRVNKGKVHALVPTATRYLCGLLTDSRDESVAMFLDTELCRRCLGKYAARGAK